MKILDENGKLTTEFLISWIIRIIIASIFILVVIVPMLAGLVG